MAQDKFDGMSKGREKGSPAGEGRASVQTAAALRGKSDRSHVPTWLDIAIQCRCSGSRFDLCQRRKIDRVSTSCVVAFKLSPTSVNPRHVGDRGALLKLMPQGA